MNATIPGFVIKMEEGYAHRDGKPPTEHISSINFFTNEQALRWKMDHADACTMVRARKEGSKITLLEK